MKNRLPDRWTEYSAVGSRIPGTRFIAFKVPLKKLFDNQLAPWERFTPTDLISEIEKKNEELGLVVDLTCTNRYYSPQELPATVKYAKIFTAGQEVPTNGVIQEFKCIIKQFLSENANNDKLIGVHCTHGLNRTGYLLCRYMIDVIGMVPSEAIEKFNQSRGHCIERENYLDDLLQGVPRNHQSASPSWGPRLSTPPFSQLPGRYIPGPQHRLQQMGGGPPGFACVNPGVRLPLLTFPFMPGPRHRTPLMTDHQLQHFGGGPQRLGPHPAGRFAPQQHYGPVNGEHVRDSAPYGGSMMYCTDGRGPGPRVHGQNGPYSRRPEQGRQRTPHQEWQ